jgi:hypothetical protein
MDAAILNCADMPGGRVEGRSASLLMTLMHCTTADTIRGVLNWDKLYTSSSTSLKKFNRKSINEFFF